MPRLNRISGMANSAVTPSLPLCRNFLQCFIINSVYRCFLSCSLSHVRYIQHEYNPRLKFSFLRVAWAGEGLCSFLTTTLDPSDVALPLHPLLGS